MGNPCTSESYREVGMTILTLQEVLSDVILPSLL